MSLVFWFLVGLFTVAITAYFAVAGYLYWRDVRNEQRHWDERRR